MQIEDNNKITNFKIYNKNTGLFFYNPFQPIQLNLDDKKYVEI